MLVNRVAYPVNSWVVTDGVVCSIHKDNLKVFVRRILQWRSNEIRKKKIRILTANVHHSRERERER